LLGERGKRGAGVSEAGQGRREGSKQAQDERKSMPTLRGGFPKNGGGMLKKEASGK